MDFPFSEVSLGNNIFLRVFDEQLDPEELVWHRDREDRTVNIVESNGWMLQQEDSLPTLLEAGKEYFIKQNEWHRVIKGKGKMILFIEKGCVKNEKI